MPLHGSEVLEPFGPVVVDAVVKRRRDGIHLLERQGIRSDDSQSQIKFIHVEGIVEGW